MTNNVSPSERNRMSLVARYAGAVLASVAALAVGRALGPILGNYVAYVAVFPVIAFSTWCCGLGPSALAMVLALAGLKYWFMPPLHTLGVVTAKHALGMFADSSEEFVG